MERHHLFPKAHLKALGLTDTKVVNAIANMSFVDWSDNLEISDKAPSVYWDEMTDGMEEVQLKRQMQHHALPKGWHLLGYEEFCEKRRHLIAKVVREAYQRLAEGQVHEDAEVSSLRELIDLGESNVLEFKESARWSHGTDQKGKSEQIIVKTITGFMNAEGGTLLIGVADSGEVTGIESDYETLSKGNRDGYGLFLTQLVMDKISGPASALCKVSFEHIDGHDVCRIDVGASGKPVFAASLQSKEQTDFWVRLGPRTDQLHGADLMDYTEDHWD